MTLSAKDKFFNLDTPNVLFLILEINFQEFFNYLPVSVINNLLFVCRFTRAKTLKLFNFVFDLTTGFTSEKHWNFILSKIALDICNSIMTLSSFYIHWFSVNFNFHEIYCRLQLTLKSNLSLFSVLLHFLRCVSSCDRVQKYPSYCSLCSRIENYWQTFESFYEGIKIEKNNSILLGLQLNMVCDLDVFVSKADDYLKYFKLKDHECSYHQEFGYTEDIFAAFSSILIRMYLRLSISIFSKFFLYLNKSDEYKIKHVIANEGSFLLGHFWHETNIDFFFELFDKFDHFSKRYCYKNKQNKPEFGPYHPSAFDTTLEVIIL